MKKFYLMIAALAAFTVSAQNAEVKTGVLEVGDYEGATALVEGSFFDVAPTTFYVAHTGSQMIYTADDLAELVTDAQKTDVKITKLTYRYYNEGFDDITRNMKVFATVTDATEFAVVDGKKQFFTFDASAPALEQVYEVSLLDAYGEDGELEVDLSASPIALEPGKGVVITMVFDAEDNDNCTEGTLVSFYSTGTRSRAMTYTHNTESFLEYPAFPEATSTSGCGTNIDLPVTKIDYTYTQASPSAITQIEAGQSDDAPYYDLMGRKMSTSNLPAGIYIHDGKKVVVK